MRSKKNIFSGNSLNLSVNGPSLSTGRDGAIESAYIFDGEQQAAQYLILNDINQIKNNEINLYENKHLTQVDCRRSCLFRRLK